MTFQPPKADAGSDLPRALRQHTREIAAAFRTLVDNVAEAVAVDVRKFGAVGDDVTDNYPFITAALAAGSSVFIPPGTYRLSAALSIPDGCTLWAIPGTVILKPTPGSAVTPLLLTVPNRATGARIVGITFDGDQANVGTMGAVTQVFNSKNVVFADCTFQNTRGIGINLSTSIQNCGIIDCLFNEVGTYSKISGLSGDRRQAIAFSSGTRANNYGNVVSGNRFSEIGLDSISFSNQSSGLITGNITNDTYASGAVVYCSNSLNVTITGNIAFSGGGNGIDCPLSTGVTIAGNLLSNCGAAGILVANASSNVTVTGNTCIDNDALGTSVHRGGITLDGTVSALSDITVTGNVCRDTRAPGSKTQRYGLYYRPTSTFTGTIWIDKSNIFTGNKLADVGGTPTPTYSLELPNAGPVRHPAYISGRWYSSPVYNQTTTAAVAANTAYAWPIVLDRDVQISTLGFRVTTGAAGNARVGLYAADTTNLIGALLAEGSTDIDTTVAGLKTGVLTATTTASAGPAWLVVVFSAAPTVTVQSATAGNWLSSMTGGPDAGPSTGGGSIPARVIQTAAVTYVAGSPFLPATFGAYTIDSTPGSPIMSWRVA